MPAPKILAFAGALRRDSWNKKLIKVAAEAARAAGGDVTLVDLRDFPMPPYDGDIEAEQGLPEHAQRFKDLMIAADAFLISSPEYNSSVPGTLKNVIDWASRPEPGPAYAGKIAGLISASPGALGGLRGLIELRRIFGNVNTLVIPEQQAITQANKAFDADGKLVDPKHQAGIERVARRLVEVTKKLKG
jgi:NAD(P)H-dependent FMN reductase